MMLKPRLPGLRLATRLPKSCCRFCRAWSGSKLFAKLNSTTKVITPRQRLNSFLPSGDFCCLLKNFAKSLNPHLDPNCLTYALIVFLKEFFEKEFCRKEFCCCLLFLPLWDTVIVLCFVHCSFAIIMMGKIELVALLVLLVYCDCCVALPHDATSLSAVFDCGIS